MPIRLSLVGDSPLDVFIFAIMSFSAALPSPLDRKGRSIAFSWPCAPASCLRGYLFAFVPTGFSPVKLVTKLLSSAKCCCRVSCSLPFFTGQKQPSLPNPSAPTTRSPEDRGVAGIHSVPWPNTRLQGLQIPHTWARPHSSLPLKWEGSLFGECCIFHIYSQKTKTWN